MLIFIYLYIFLLSIYKLGYYGHIWYVFEIVFAKNVALFLQKAHLPIILFFFNNMRKNVTHAENTKTVYVALIKITIQ